MRLYIIRHGQTSANRDRVFYDDTLDLPLTELGQEQALKVRPILEKISFDRVYSSDYRRAIQTQQIAMPYAENVIRTPLLREISAGWLGGKPSSFIYDNLDKYDGWTPMGDKRAYEAFGGESMEMVGQRLRTFLKQLEEDPCDRVAVFAHGAVMACLLRVVLEADDFCRGAVFSANCAIHVFDFDGTRWKLMAWNYGATLD